MVRVPPHDMFPKTTLSKIATIFLSGVAAPDNFLQFEVMPYLALALLAKLGALTNFSKNDMGSPLRSQEISTKQLLKCVRPGLPHEVPLAGAAVVMQ